jgi:hypothetical protein
VFFVNTLSSYTGACASKNSSHVLFSVIKHPFFLRV